MLKWFANNRTMPLFGKLIHEFQSALANVLLPRPEASPAPSDIHMAHRLTYDSRSPFTFKNLRNSNRILLIRIDWQINPKTVPLGEIEHLDSKWNWRKQPPTERLTLFRCQFNDRAHKLSAKTHLKRLVSATEGWREVADQSHEQIARKRNKQSMCYSSSFATSTSWPFATL